MARLPLWLKLAATMLCLTCAGLGAIGVAGVSVFRDYLMSQADRQVQTGAQRLAGRSFVVGPDGGPVLGDVGAPDLSVEVLGADGARLEAVGPGAEAGPVIRAGTTWVLAHQGRPVTVTAGGQRWRVILEPVRYQVRHVPFIYAANDYTVDVASGAVPGLPGTLIIGTDLSGIARQTRRLAATELAVGAIAAIALAALGTAVIRTSMWRPAEIEKVARAVAAGELSCRVTDRHMSREMGRTVRALNMMLSRVEEELHAMAAAEAAAGASRERMCQRVAQASQGLRTPLSIIAGLAARYRRRGPLAASELDAIMSRIAQEAARLAATADTLGMVAAPGRDLLGPP